MSKMPNKAKTINELDNIVSVLFDALKLLKEQPQHKTGKWTNHELTPDFERNIVIDSYECSECGMKCSATTPFCPFCGADMRIIQS